ncbi:MAG: delta-60 repeat domain-containing protein [Tepidisphaeraceae bacterium]
MGSRQSRHTVLDCCSLEARRLLAVFAQDYSHAVPGPFDVPTSDLVVAVSKGRFITAGERRFSAGPGETESDIVHEMHRILRDGSIDKSFGRKGTIEYGGYVAKQPIFTGTRILTLDEGPGFRQTVFAYTVNGKPDETFGGGKGWVAVPGNDVGDPTDANIVKVNDDSSIFVLAEHYKSGAPLSYDLVKLAPDGSIDTTFGKSGDYNASMTILPAGIYVRDVVTVPGPASASRLRRYRLDGSGLDSSFGNQGEVVLPRELGTPTELIEQGDGKLLYLDVTADDGVPRLRRLNANGSVDTGFGTGGVVRLFSSHNITDRPGAQAQGLRSRSTGRAGSWPRRSKPSSASTPTAHPTPPRSTAAGSSSAT